MLKKYLDWSECCVHCKYFFINEKFVRSISKSLQIAILMSSLKRPLRVSCILCLSPIVLGPCFVALLLYCICYVNDVILHFQIVKFVNLLRSIGLIL